MNANTMNQPSRRLPSIDWIALGLGVLALALSRIQAPGWSSWVGLVGLAVFGPPLLRELGWLKDEDEFSRDMRWRAGFHAALILALFLFLNKALYPLIASHPDAMARKIWFFPPDYLRESLVLVFLLSFLIQYWGAPKGVFRILLGIAGISIIELVGVLFVLLFISVLREMHQSTGNLEMRLGVIRSAVYILLVFGATGISLLKAAKEDTA